MPEQDPWEEQAKQFKASPQSQQQPTTGTDDWKLWQSNAKPQASTGEMLGQAGMSALGEIAHNLNPVNIYQGAKSMLTHPVDTLFTPEMKAFRDKATAIRDTKPKNFTNFGDAVSNLIYGTVPVLGPMAAKVLNNTDNPEEAGRGLGDVASLKVPGVIGDVAGKVAPKLAEAALGIPGKARAFGRTPGKAIIEETRGIRPETIAETGRARLGELNPQLEAAAASEPRPVASMTPARDVVRHGMDLAKKQNALPIHAQLKPMASSLQRQFLDLPTDIKPSIPASSMALSSQKLANFGSGPPGISLDTSPRFSGANAAHLVVRDSGGNPIGFLKAGKAGSNIAPEVFVEPAFRKQGVASSLYGEAPKHGLDLSASGSQTTPEGAAFLNARNAALNAKGEPIPEFVTPSRLLDIKRGFGKSYPSWNPDLHESVNNTAKAAYRELDNELDRAVPEAAGLNQRISSLIPAVNRAETVSRNAGIAQKTLGRVAAHTGALTGAAAGFHYGGIPGAALGLVVPELLGSPEAQMIAARTASGINKLPAKTAFPLIGSTQKTQKDDQDKKR